MATETLRKFQVTSPRRVAPLPTCLLAAGFGLFWLVSVPECRAADPAPKSTTETPVAGEGIYRLGESELPVGGGNYDYFTADRDPGLAKYLAILTGRHASERVWALFWAGKYSEPLGDCEYALVRFPNHPRALNLMAEIAKATNQPSMAITYFEYALKLYPQYAFTHAQYGHFLIDIGAVAAGVRELREALRLDPDQFQAKAWLSQALASHPELREVAPDSASSASVPGRSAGEPKGNR